LLIETEVTRVQMSNVPQLQGERAQTSHFIDIPRYPPAGRRLVSAPNAVGGSWTWLAAA
jgi:2-keto-3-deoxy-L-rhamnonate aldolase RhmA